MKKFIIFLTAILLVTCLVTACSSNDSKSKENNTKKEEIRLLESITYDNGGYTKYEYDNKNRITKISEYHESGDLGEESTLVYNGNDLVKHNLSYIIHEYEKDGNSITIRSRFKDNEDYEDEYSEIDLSINGNIISCYYKNQSGVLLDRSFQYTCDENGNLIKLNSNSGHITIKYEYDTKNAPFIHCNTPKWWMQYNSLQIKNNIIKQSEENSDIGEDIFKHEYVYEYDDAGYPIKQTSYRDGEISDVRVYKYRSASSSNDN